MPRAIELDENGKMVLTNGIAFGPQPGQLKLANLKRGDILVWYSTSRSRISSVIREFSGGPYSHIGIYTGNALSVDAGPAGVEEMPVGMSADSYAQVMRKSGLTALEQADVVAAARKFIGYRYAWLDAVTLPLRRRFYWRRHGPRRKMDWVTGRAWLSLLGNCLTWLRRHYPPPKKIFCSQVIVEAYAAIGYFPLELAEEGVFTPNDLAVDTIFVHQGWLCSKSKPTWHPLDPYSPEPVRQRQWRFSVARIFRGTSTGGK